MTKTRGRQLARELISGDPAVVAAAKKEIGKAPPVVTNAAARQLAKFLAAGADTQTPSPHHRRNNFVITLQ